MVNITNLLNWRKSMPVSSMRQQQNPFLAMQAAMDKAMEDFYQAFESSAFPGRVFENLAIMPAIDVIDDKDHFKVELEMPGIGEDDIQISINDNMLNIKAEKETSRQDKDKNYVMREISYGAYERNIRLPDSVDADKAKASFKKGMLWVDIPKKAEASQQSRQLKIEKA